MIIVKSTGTSLPRRITTKHPSSRFCPSLWATLKVPGEIMLKKLLNGLIDRPLFTSLFIADFFVLVFHRPPFLFSVVMLGGLVAMSLYLGQKLELFENK